MAARRLFPESIGMVVADWIEANCVHGPGDIYGQPVVLTPEEHAWLAGSYRVDRDTGARLVDQSVYERPKGTRKSELLSWVGLAECVGPVRARIGPDGHPEVGPVTDPYIVIAATTQDQAETTVFGAMRTIIAASPTLRPLFEVGLERILLRGQPGRIELVAPGKPGALDGARPTFTIGDELHLWFGPTLLEAAAVLKRNLRKRATSQPWLAIASTAYRAGQRSALEALHEQAGRHATTGTKIVGRLLYDRRQARPDWDLTDRDQLLAAIVEAGGDAYWRNAELIAEEYNDPAVSEAEFRRYWLGQVVARSQAFIDPADWEACRAGSQGEGPEVRPLTSGDRLCLGFDGSLTEDHTALVAARLDDGAVFLLGHWVPPAEGRLDTGDIDSAVRAVFEVFDVVRMMADPSYWQDIVAGWQADYGDRVRAQYPTAYARMGRAFEGFRTAVRAHQLHHDGHPTLAAHVANAVEHDRRGILTISKATPWSPDKIDAAMAAVLAWMARTEAIADGMGAPPPEYAYYAF